MSKRTVSSIVTLSFVLATLGSVPANADVKRTGPLRLTNMNATSTKNVARAQTTSPFTAQKISAALKGNSGTTATKTSLGSSQRISSLKHTATQGTSQSTSGSPNIAKIDELENRIEQLQAQLEHKAESDAVAKFMVQMYTDLDSKIDDNKIDMDTVESNMKDVLDGYVTNTVFDATKNQLTKQITNNTQRVSALRTDFENDTTFETKLANSAQLNEKLAAVESATKSELNQKIAQIETTAQAVETEIANIKSNYIPKTDRAQIVSEATSVLDSQNFVTKDKLESALSPDNIKNKLGDTYLAKAEVSNAVNNELESKNFATKAELAQVALDAKIDESLVTTAIANQLSAELTTEKLTAKLGDSYLKRTDKDSILSEASNAVDSKLNGYVKDTALAEKGFLTADTLTTKNLTDKLNDTYLKQTDKDSILSEASNAVDSKLNGYVKDTALAEKGFLTADTLTTEKLTAKLNDTYLKQTDKDSILSEASNAVDSKLNGYVTNDSLNSKGFLTEKTPVVQTISQNINNINTNLGKTVTAINNLDNRISESEKSLQTVVPTFVPLETKKIDISEDFKPVSDLKIEALAPTTGPSDSIGSLEP